METFRPLLKSARLSLFVADKASPCTCFFRFSARSLSDLFSFHPSRAFARVKWEVLRTFCFVLVSAARSLASLCPTTSNPSRYALPPPVKVFRFPLCPFFSLCLLLPSLDPPQTPDIIQRLKVFSFGPFALFMRLQPPPTVAPRTLTGRTAPVQAFSDLPWDLHPFFTIFVSRVFPVRLFDQTGLELCLAKSTPSRPPRASLAETISELFNPEFSEFTYRAPSLFTL